MPVNIGVNIQRSPNRINQQLREAGVEGKFPKLLLDFKDQYYLASGGSKTLANAVTHARSGNATMTDGYGPELVTNGGFSNGTTGWSVSTNLTATVSSGKAELSASGGFGYFSQDIGLEVGTAYQITLSVSQVSGTILIRNGASAESPADNYHTISSTGDVEIFVNPSTTGSFLIFVFGSGESITIDNVSVREMPVLKWAPHNLVLYSEQFDNAVWAKVRTAVTANQIAAPDGTTTADKIIETAETGNHFIVDSSSVSFSVGEIGTSAVFLKAGERSAAVMQITDPSSPSRTRLQAIIDLSAGTITTQEFNSPTDVKSSITDAGNGWYLVKLSMATKAAGPMECLFGPLDSTSYTTNLPSYTGDGSSGIYAWGAHIFRSDLGGMVDNPDRGDSYVPTTSTAKYLPRIGHHVYNGSAWVNEGLLAESEARTNIVTYSNELSNANWTKINATVTANSAIAPDGNNDAFELAEEANTGNHFAYAPSQSFTSGNAYTISAFIKAGTKNIIQLAGTSSGFGTTLYGNFDLANGVVGSAASGVVSTIEDVGNGWYRCAITGDATSTASGTAAIVIMIDSISSGRLPSFTGSASNNVYVYGFQTEQASTPSSYIPTGSATVTRAAETFTIPSANLPWPSPNYIGSELVTNGTFDTDVSGWPTIATNPPTWDAGRLSQVHDNGPTGAYQAFTTEIGKVYEATGTLVSSTAFSTNTKIRVGNGSTPNAGLADSEVISANNTTVSVVFVATGTTSYVYLRNDSSATTLWDNVSVREIDPLSVSIAMDGRVTYADEGVYVSSSFFRWTKDANDYIEMYLDTFGVNTGRLYLKTSASGTVDYSGGSASDFYDPDVLVPFDISSRIGSTFMQAAGQGNLALENTTPTALPDLETEDLDLAYDYMGTIGTFRVWDRDIGDTGLVEATNPSLEPSLSLTFEGVGSNSFVVNDWSE